MNFEKINRQNLHPANLLICDFESIEKDIFDVVENDLKIETKANEFFFFEKYDKFLIDDARKVFDLHLKKTPKDDLQVFVIAFNFITTEAQNALLKMFEEPKARTHFFIISPSKSLFLETILSRVNLIESQVSSPKSKSLDFLNMNIGERIKFIADLTKDIKGDKAVKQDAIDLLSGLELELYKKAEASSLKAQGLKSIIEARKYINLSGASVKILLESVALSV